jgi:hypothetical protein
LIFSFFKSFFTQLLRQAEGNSLFKRSCGKISKKFIAGNWNHVCRPWVEQIIIMAQGLIFLTRMQQVGGCNAPALVWL